MKIFNKFKLVYLSKAYTEGIYADTPTNRKLGRVGISYQQYTENLKKQISAKEIKEEKEKLSEEQIKNIQEEFSKFCNSINFGSDYELQNNKLKKSINTLFPNSEVLIEKRKPYYGKSTFHKDTIIGYEREVKFQYKGNEYKITFQINDIFKKSNIKISIKEGENYIHYYTLVENSSNYLPTVYKKNVKELFNKIQEQKSKYTKENYFKQLEGSFENFETKELKKAYTEGIYADTPANRKLGRVGMSYIEYANKQKGISEKETLKLSDFKEDILNDDNQLRVSYTDKEGNKVGEIVFFKEPEEKILYLEHINVYGDNKKKGLGRQILKKGLQLANKEGEKFDKIQLWVDNADNQFTSNEEEQKKNNQYLVDFYKSEGFEFKSKEDENELNPYMEKKIKKVFTLEQIKSKVSKEVDKLKKKNDYITISTDNGYTFRFSRNANGQGEFNECLIKDKDGKVLKIFKNSHEEDLMNSVYKYIQGLNVDIVSTEQKDTNSSNIDIEKNTSVIKKKMQEAKDNQIGTVVIKGGDKLVYLNRDKKGRWLKDFNAYTIRDSKRNILSQGKADSEESLIKKINEELSKYNISLEI